MRAGKPGKPGMVALRSFLRQHKFWFLAGDALRIIASFSIALQPYFFAKLATSVNDKDQAFKYLVLFFGANVAHGILWAAADYVYALKLSPYMYEFKKIAFENVWSKDYETFIEKPSGKVGNYVNDLKNEVFHLWDAYEYGLIPIVASMPVYLFLFYQAAWQSSAFYAVFVIFAITALTWLTKPIEKSQQTLTDSNSSNSGRVFDSYANFVNVFSFRSHPKEIKRNREQLDEVIRHEVAATTNMINYWVVASFMIRVCLWSAILFYSWYLFDTGRMSLEALIISITVLIDFTAQFWELVHHIGVWTRNSATYNEAYSYLFGEQDIVANHYSARSTSGDRNATIETPPFNHSIEICDLSFAYPDAPDQYMLKNINLKISRNEKIGLVGKSGEGKSTLVKILLGFYKPTTGEIKVDGVAVSSEKLSALYSYVPQDTTLFQESIFYNIAYAKKDEASLEEVKEAATKARIATFIEQLPNGYDTLVGERGVKLSLGQRQRIAIARSFLQPSSLLILDEATSALDSQTESLVQESFETLWENKAVIAIAHRLSTLNNVDRIVVLQGGEIIEQGTKQELLNNQGSFSELWQRQRAGMI